MTLQSIAIQRARVLLSIITNPETPAAMVEANALRFALLLDTHGVLDLAEVGHALIQALAAMIALATVALNGCEHASPGLLCPECEAIAREALANARRTMVHAIEGEH